MDLSTLTLNNGAAMPAVGFGVFQAPAEETIDPTYDVSQRRTTQTRGNP